MIASSSTYLMQSHERKEGERMSQRNGLSKRTEKGLLTPDNCVVALIDHQPQMLFGVSSTDRQSIINNTLAFAKAAQVFGLPVVLSTVETEDCCGDVSQMAHQNSMQRVIQAGAKP